MTDDKNSSYGRSNLKTASTSVPPDNPLEYIPQSQFNVGKAVTTAPFVTPSQIKTHLGLLRAFRELELKVKDPTTSFLGRARALDPEARWVWFLELALERYAIHSHSPFKVYNQL